MTALSDIKKIRALILKSIINDIASLNRGVTVDDGYEIEPRTSLFRQLCEDWVIRICNDVNLSHYDLLEFARTNKTAVGQYEPSTGDGMYLFNSFRGKEQPSPYKYLFEIFGQYT